ncbi:hypothetical protein NL108_009882 [Boleophthalmus pectinirostris]|nr:hypothetical protein NL108_009882 [Boleophthalmus pectinirostris]
MAQFSSSTCHCSVLLRSANQQLHSNLSFHNFPTDPQLQAHWVHAGRRDEDAKFKMIPNSTYVCIFILLLMTFTSLGFITMGQQVQCQYNGSCNRIFPNPIPIFLVCDVSVNRAH